MDTSQETRRIGKFYPYFILVLLGLLVFLRVTTFSFLNIDDQTHLLKNPAFLAFDWTHFSRIWSQPYFDLYIPISYSFWWALSFLLQTLDFQAGASPGVFHSANLLLHLFNTLLVYKLISRFTKAEVASLLASLLFLLHPLQVETIAWVSCGRDLLCCFFMLAAINTAKTLRFSIACAEGQKTILLFTLALLSKPGACTLPLVFLVLLWQSSGRLRLNQSLALLPYFALSLLSIGITFLSQSLDATSSIVGSKIPLQVIDNLTFYFIKYIAPWPLSIDYGHSTSLSPWPTIMFLATLGLLFVARKKIQTLNPLFFTGLCISLCGLLPILGLIPFEFEFHANVADRYVYFPTFGVALIFAGFLVNSRRLVKGLAVIALLICCLLTSLRLPLWKNEESLLSDTLKVNPESLMASYGLGNFYFTQGDYAKALEYFHQANRIKPEALYPREALGLTMARLGQIEEAKNYFKEMLKAAPLDPSAKNQLIYQRLRDYIGQ